MPRRPPLVVLWLCSLALISPTLLWAQAAGDGGLFPTEDLAVPAAREQLIAELRSSKRTSQQLAGPLGNAIQKGRPLVQINALLVVPAMDPKVGVPLAVAALNDPSAGVRYRAYRALRDGVGVEAGREASAIPVAVVKAVTNETSPAVVDQAFGLLLDLDGKGVAGALSGVLDALAARAAYLAANPDYDPVTENSALYNSFQSGIQPVANTPGGDEKVKPLRKQLMLASVRLLQAVTPRSGERPFSETEKLLIRNAGGIAEYTHGRLSEEKLPRKPAEGSPWGEWLEGARAALQREPYNYSADQVK